MSLFLRYETRMRRTYQRALSDLQVVGKIENAQKEPSPIFEQ